MQLLLKLYGRILTIFFTGIYFLMVLWVDIKYSFSLNPLVILIKLILQEKNASVTRECLNFSSLRVIQVCLELVISLPQPLSCPASLSFLKAFC